MVTLSKTNSKFAPENGWLEDEGLPFGMADGLFSRAFAVSFREGSHSFATKTLLLYSAIFSIGISTGNSMFF